LAAFTSRCRRVPPSGRECQRIDKPFGTITPQPEHLWLVSAGGTATTRRPASAAWVARRLKIRAPPGGAAALGAVVVLDPVGRLPIHVIDRVALPTEVERHLVGDVLAVALHLQVRLRQQLHRRLAAVAARLAARHPALGRLEHPLRCAGAAGVWISGPSARVAKDSTPRSPPVSWLVAASGCAGPSAHEQQTDQPSASRATVAVVGVSSIGRDQRTAIRPLVDRTTKPLSRRAPVPTFWSVQRFERHGPWQRGEPGVCPSRMRRKTAGKALSRRASPSCRAGADVLAVRRLAGAREGDAAARSVQRRSCGAGAPCWSACGTSHARAHGAAPVQREA
jgi:hypothetical protein